MNKIDFVIWTCWLLVIVSCVAAVDRAAVGAEDATPEQYRPAWKVGQKWVVETVSQQSQARRALEPGQTRAPVRWQFEVQAHERVENSDCFKVLVKCLAAGQHPETTLWVDQQAMTLRKVESQLPIPGGFRTVTETYRSASGQPFPAFAPLTVPPLELPLFLAGTKGRQTFSYQASSHPAGRKALGEIDFAFEVEQTVTRPQPENIKGLLPQDSIKSLAQDPNVERSTIDVRLKTARTSVRQLWQPGLPWPLYSNNGIATAKLVKVIQPTNDPEP